MKVIFIPDLHLTDCHREEILDELSLIFSEMKNVDRVFFLGDIITRESYHKDKKKFEDFRDLVSSFDFNYTILKGNHESDSKFSGEILDLFNQKRYYGIIREGDINFIYLDTNHPKTSDFYLIGNKQMKWFKRVAESSSEFILLSHHPVFDFDLSKNHWLPENPEKLFTFDRRNAIRIARDNNCIGSIGGHVHKTKTKKDRNEFHVLLDTFYRRYGGDYITNSHMKMKIDKSKITMDFFGEENFRYLFNNYYI